MNPMYKFAYIVLLAMLSQLVQAVPFGIEARSLAMGNASVATADIATASFANPAMLAYQQTDDNFALLIPAVGLYIDDSDGIKDLIDQYRAAESVADQVTQLNVVNQMFGKVVEPQLSVATAIGYAGRNFAVSLSARSDLIAGGGLTNPALSAPELSDPAKNILRIEGVNTLEIGASLAGNMRFLGRKISIGVTPKIISVEQTSFSESISTLKTDTLDLLDDSQTRDLGSYNTLDVGAVMELSRSIHLGIVARNLIEHEIRFISSNGQPATLVLASSYRAGLAYRSNFMTFGADLDLNEVDAPLSLFQADKRRMLSIGAEFNAFDFAQLRVGLQKNTASGISEGGKNELLTAGVGFWFGFHLDVTAALADDVLGLFVQTGFRF